MTLLIITVGILYVLGAYFMWIVADEDEPDDMKKRSYYAVFWPCVVIAIALENLIMKGEE